MTVLVLHDREGSIAGLNDPHRVSEIDATESELEFTREHDERRALEALSSLRVEVASPTRLVRRSNRRKPIGEAPRDTARP
jgi:hypothetical protein